MRESIRKFIKTASRGRTVVLWGRDNALRRDLEADGLSVEDSDIADRSLLARISRENQYVFFPSAPWSSQREADLTSRGLTNDDFAFAIHRPVIVHGDYTRAAFEDPFGNLVSGNIKGKLILRGYGSIIKLGSALSDNAVLDVTSDVSVYIGKRVILDSEIIVKEGASIDIGDDCKLWSTTIHAYEYAKITIGESSTFLLHTHLALPFRTALSIGKDFMGSHYLYIICSDGHAIFDVPTGKRINPNDSSIVIGDHVWAGVHVTILPGTTVGSGSVIGAKATVKGRYPNNCIIAGSIARVIRKDIAWSRSIMAEDIGKCPSEYVHKTSDER